MFHEDYSSRVRNVGLVRTTGNVGRWEAIPRRAFRGAKNRVDRGDRNWKERVWRAGGGGAIRREVGDEARSWDLEREKSVRDVTG